MTDIKNEDAIKILKEQDIKDQLNSTNVVDPIEEFKAKQKLVKNNNRKSNRRKSTIVKHAKQNKMNLKVFASMVLRETNQRFHEVVKGFDLTKETYTKEEVVKLLTTLRSDKMFEATIVMYMHYFYRAAIEKYKEWSNTFQPVLMEAENEAIRAELEADIRKQKEAEAQAETPEVEVIEPKKTKKVKAEKVVDANEG